MRQSTKCRIGQTIFLLVIFYLALAQSAQIPCVLAQADNANGSLRSPEEKNTLEVKQARLSERYQRLELLAGRLAELSRATQPRRARLLGELISRSRERDINGRFEMIVDALEKDRLGKANADQVTLQADLQKLLDLLLQEDRDRQIESQRKRVQKYLAEVKRLIQRQRGIKARTEGGDEPAELIKDQEKLADKTNKLQQQIEASEGSSKSDTQSSGDQNSNDDSKSDQSNEPSDAKSQEDDSTEGSSEDQESDQKDKKSKNDVNLKKAADQNSKDEKNSDKSSDQQSDNSESSDENSPNNTQRSEQNSSNQPNQEGQQNPSQRSQGQPSQGQPSSDQNNSLPSEDQPQFQSPAERAQQKLRQAQQRMRHAQEKLEEAQKENALEKQEQALRELEQAKVELERILRQLREEELERTLVLLEARFRKMLDAQVEVYEQTKKLAASQATVPEHEIEIASGRLDRQERQIIREANRALALLREDGTTVAFSEAIEQARDDMQTVANRLGEVKLGEITQGLEEDVITALEETLAALQKALEEARKKKSQPPQSGQQSQPDEQSLVDSLAELRMIRALQNRINRRTERYGKILGNQPALEEELLAELDALAIRQERVFKATRDLDSGRNR